MAIDCGGVALLTLRVCGVRGLGGGLSITGWGSWGARDLGGGPPSDRLAELQVGGGAGWLGCLFVGFAWGRGGWCGFAVIHVVQLHANNFFGAIEKRVQDIGVEV